MMPERTRFTSGPTHVWGFYSDHRLAIRKLLIEPDKRPLIPLARALSLAKEHPSLQKSYIETGKGLDEWKAEIQSGAFALQKQIVRSDCKLLTWTIDLIEALP